MPRAIASLTAAVTAAASFYRATYHPVWCHPIPKAIRRDGPALLRVRMAHTLCANIYRPESSCSIPLSPLLLFGPTVRRPLLLQPCFVARFSGRFTAACISYLQWSRQLAGVHLSNTTFRCTLRYDHAGLASTSASLGG